ncbi:histidine phosphatase family protein [Rhizobium sp. RU33A]|uniref:histidine phosphatase family protein n=1 Tax=Rhizobium sp. RU33A TaxID=1907413 RepID=UPI001FCDA5FF|nr:histidine phosphatase family protein [Rhizobium sp. RU33A]
MTSLFVLASKPARSADPWEELRTRRAFVLLRHAIAPGTGDPPGMRLGDCSTQRNLSDEGRTQAQRIGSLLREKGIDRAAVYSSEWCRCLDTARLMDLGPVSPQPLLNSFFGLPENGATQTEALRAWLSSSPGDLPLVLVTHQVNITGLTSIVPRSGELVFTTMNASGAISVIGRQSAGA